MKRNGHSPEGREAIDGYQTFSPAHHECPGGVPHVQGMACNSTVTQALSAEDCALSDQSYADFWSFSGAANEPVTIQMTAAFDTYLFLLDPNGVVVTQDDDGGGGTNSRIEFTLTQSGTWLIAANSFAANTFGPYTLTLACVPHDIPTLSFPALLLLMVLLAATGFFILRRG